MLQKAVLLLILLCLSLQALSLSISPEKGHTASSSQHQLLHFLAEPHSHDDEDPSKITLGFSAEAREHVACDAHSCTIALLTDTSVTCNRLHSTPDFSCLQALADPYLQRLTPPPRA